MSGKRGRPARMTMATFEKICALMADGRSVKSICAMPTMPSRSIVFRFIAADALAAEMYARAIEARADAHFEEILAIADDPKLKTADQIRRAKLRIEARQWVVQRMHPQKYSERLHLRHGGDRDAPPIKTESETQFPIGLVDVYEKVGALFAAGRAMAPASKPSASDDDGPDSEHADATPASDETALPPGSRIEKGKLVIPL